MQPILAVVRDGCMTCGPGRRRGIAISGRRGMPAAGFAINNIAVSALLAGAKADLEQNLGLPLESHHMVHLGADADPFADGVVVVAGHMGQQGLAVVQAQIVRKSFRGSEFLYTLRLDELKSESQNV